MDIDTLYRDLAQHREILREEPMARHTTFHIGGPADLYMELTQEEDLDQILRLARHYEVPVTVMGNGSNLLVADRGIRGLVLVIGDRLAAVQVHGNQVAAQAGARLTQLAQRAMEGGLAGLEFAAGIPGALGGAIYMNAGAYGGEMAQCLTHVRYFDGREILERPVETGDFGYRWSFFHGTDWVILGGRFLLEPGSREEIAARMEDLNRRRREKQPLNYRSAGSAFKRPPGHFAAALIEEAGLKGFRVGDAQVSEKHAGFIVNRGEATAQEVCRLIEQVQARVFQQFQVMLEPEVKKIGDFGGE